MMPSISLVTLINKEHEHLFCNLALKRVISIKILHRFSTISTEMLCSETMPKSNITLLFYYFAKLWREELKRIVFELANCPLEKTAQNFQTQSKKSFITCVTQYRNEESFSRIAAICTVILHDSRQHLSCTEKLQFRWAYVSIYFR